MPLTVPELAERYETRFANALLKLWDQRRKAINTGRLVAAVSLGADIEAERYLTKAEIPKPVGGEFDPDDLSGLYQDLIQEGANIGLQDWGFQYSFTLNNEAAIKWAESRAADLIMALDNEVRETVRSLIAQAQQGDFTVKQLARQIEAAGVGLTPAQQQSVLNFQRGLTSAIERDLSPKWVKDQWSLSPWSGGKLTSDRVTTLVEQYSGRLRKYRAKNIARTETMTAAMEGKRSLWEQAKQRGLLSEDQERQWMTAGDERTCPLCEPMDGAITDRGTYPNGSDGPPLHPSCRCDESLLFRAENNPRFVYG